MDSYDYSSMTHFIEEFHNPFSDRPFITEMEENYGMLWQFKDGRLVYPATKDALTYFTRSRTRRHFCH
jgi:hypothetical protein